MNRNPRRNPPRARPVSWWFDFLVISAVIAGLAALLFLLPGCEERDGRPTVPRPIGCDFADADPWEC